MLLNIIQCQLWKSPRARIVETHKHEYSEIFVLFQGTYEYEVKKQKHVARAGDVVIYPPGLIHTEQNPPEDPPEMYIVRLHWWDMPHDTPLQIYDRDGRLRIMAEWLHLYRKHDANSIQPILFGYVHGLVAEVARLMRNLENELVTDTKRYIYEHLSEPLTLTHLARRVHLSRSHFACQYQKLSGVSPMDYVRQMRLERARQLLLCTDLPPKCVAEKVGFSCASALLKALRKHKGISPEQLRRKE